MVWADGACRVNAPALKLVPPPFEGFDGELTPANFDRLIAELHEANEEISGLQTTIRMQAGRMTRLEKALEDADPSTHPQHAAMVALVERWKRVCGHPRAKVSRDRLDLIKARLKDGYEVRHLELAIDGIAAYPYVVQGQRRREGHPSQRHDSLSIALKGGENTERFAVLGHKARGEGGKA